MNRFPVISCSVSKELYRSVSFIEKLWILRKLAYLSDLTEITHSNEFQKTALYRLLYLSEILPKWTKWRDFNEIHEIKQNEQISVIPMEFQERVLYRSVSNEQISRDFLLDIKRATFGDKY